MFWLQLVCLGIVLLYWGLRFRREAHPAAFVTRMSALTVAAWIGEDSAIELYGFYSYDSGWNLFVHHVPLLIVLIWPVVIHSAWDLARHVTLPESRWTPWVTGAIVLGDAALIEPIAVHAGLWRWTEPGIFNVPPVGILGWGIFAGICAALLSRRPLGLIVLLAPMLLHGALLIAWWGLLRWLNTAVPDSMSLGGAWVTAVFTLWLSRKRAATAALPIWTLMLRLPGALFFFALLTLSDPGLVLVVYAAAFALPYLSVTGAAVRHLRQGPGLSP